MGGGGSRVQAQASSSRPLLCKIEKWVCPKKGTTGEYENVTLKKRPITIIFRHFGVTLGVENFQTYPNV